MRFTIVCLLSLFGFFCVVCPALAGDDAEPQTSEMSVTENESPPVSEIQDEPATCTADVDQEAVAREAIARAQQQIREARKAQLELWKEKGWTEEEAAAAGEVVVLNGSGYNYRPTARPLAD